MMAVDMKVYHDGASENVGTGEDEEKSSGQREESHTGEPRASLLRMERAKRKKKAARRQMLHS